MKQADRSAPVTPITLERLDELVGGLTIEERAGLTGGIDAWHPAGAPSIGLRHLHAVRHGPRRDLGRGPDP